MKNRGNVGKYVAFGGRFLGRDVLTWMIFDVLVKDKCFIVRDSVMNQLCLKFNISSGGGTLASNSNLNACPQRQGLHQPNRVARPCQEDPGWDHPVRVSEGF